MATVEHLESGGAARSDSPSPQSAPDRSPFTPIAKYGFLSNCRTGALVAPDGTVAWLCVPRFRGNFPQAFSHLALVEATARIIVAESLAEEARR